MPGLLIVVKWVVLGVFGKLTSANIVDVPFAALSFAIWVVTRAQPQGSQDLSDDRFLGAALLVVYPALYFVGVWAWMVSTDALWTRFIVSALAIVLFFLVPCLVLGLPEDRSALGGGNRG
jgi:hypothetical protein